MIYNIVYLDNLHKCIHIHFRICFQREIVIFFSRSSLFFCALQQSFCAGNYVHFVMLFKCGQSDEKHYGCQLFVFVFNSDSSQHGRKKSNFFLLLFFFCNNNEINYCCKSQNQEKYNGNSAIQTQSGSFYQTKSTRF